MLLIIYGVETVWLTQIFVNNIIFRAFRFRKLMFNAEQQRSLKIETQKKTDNIDII